jgi:hypothetical protein
MQRRSNPRDVHEHAAVRRKSRIDLDRLTLATQRTPARHSVDEYHQDAQPTIPNRRYCLLGAFSAALSGERQSVLAAVRVGIA